MKINKIILEKIILHESLVTYNGVVECTHKRKKIKANFSTHFDDFFCHRYTTISPIITSMTGVDSFTDEEKENIEYEICSDEHDDRLYGKLNDKAFIISEISNKNAKIAIGGEHSSIDNWRG